MFLIGYGGVLLDGKMVPKNVWPLISSSCILLNIMSRVPQIISIYSSKSTGVLSFITFFLACAGSYARLATVLIESDDLLYKTQFCISAGLNTTILIQFGLYWGSKDATADKKNKTAEAAPKGSKKT